MNLSARCKQGTHDHMLDVEMLPQEYSILVQRTYTDCEDPLIAVLAYPL